MFQKNKGFFRNIDRYRPNAYMVMGARRMACHCVGVVMAPRAYWKGYLKLSLVSCPIALYPAASSSERVSFNRINKKTGNRLKQQNVDSETGEPVDKEDIGRGYEVGKGQYLLVEDEELEKIQIESTHTIEIDSFVPRAGDRRPLSRQPLLHRADRSGRAGGVCGHPRCHP